MGTGSYLPREKARRLLEQRGNTTLAKDRFKVIDMYFSIWTNQYPYQLVNYLTPLDQKNDWGTERVSDHWGVVFRNMVSISFPFLLLFKPCNSLSCHFLSALQAHFLRGTHSYIFLAAHF